MESCWFHPMGDGSGDGPGYSQVCNDENHFVISLDLHHFKPEEIKVVIRNNNLTVTGKHDKINEHNSGSFGRRYIIPNNVDPEQCVSTLSADGILTIEAPVMKFDDKPEHPFRSRRHLNIFL